MKRIIGVLYIQCVVYINIGKGIETYKTIAIKLMYIPNINSQNYPFYGLQLVVETFGHST